VENNYTIIDGYNKHENITKKQLIALIKQRLKETKIIKRKDNKRSILRCDWCNKVAKQTLINLVEQQYPLYFFMGDDDRIYLLFCSADCLYSYLRYYIVHEI
jgi:DNA-directed RNA polymerase beta' subunit